MFKKFAESMGMGNKDFSEQDVDQAKNIWGMLDEMAKNNPQEYDNFVKKNINEGMSKMKVQETEKQNSLKVLPHEGFLLKMLARLQK